MRHLRHLTSPMNQQKIADVTFHLDPSDQNELVTVLQRFFAKPDQHALLDIPEKTRSVFLLEGERKWVLKHNRLTHWKKQLQNFLGLKRVFGLHDLTNEFINLSVVSAKSESSPRVAEFGHVGRFPFLKEEYLLVSFFDNHCSVDDRLIAQPEQTQTLLSDIFQLFGRTLVEGFLHMYPHPKNILIGPDGRLGFLLGYFYRFWFNKFISVEHYNACCERYLKHQHPALNRAVFQAVYERFRDRDVSRSTRYRILTCPKAQAASLRELM
ncbi:protein kinase [Pseudomonas mandelii]|uniref:Protein kinase n=1 Tax=Pseudomonas mandelii TaxID=75612 RepID=A0A502I6U1_9PSED|nr:protein kinase [Pseudomonas mandelii]TPG82591.1 protein kinase [Pseudomonas mandelii]